MMMSRDKPSANGSQRDKEVKHKSETIDSRAEAQGEAMAIIVGASGNEAETQDSPAEKAAWLVELCNKALGSQHKDGAQSQHIQSGTIEQEHSEQHNDGGTRAQTDHNQGLKAQEGERRKQGVPKRHAHSMANQQRGDRTGGTDSPSPAVVPTTAVRALAEPSHQQNRHQQEPGQETGQGRGLAPHAAQQVEVVFPEMIEINAELHIRLESLEGKLARIREQG